MIIQTKRQLKQIDNRHRRKVTEIEEVENLDDGENRKFRSLYK